MLSLISIKVTWSLNGTLVCATVPPSLSIRIGNLNLDLEVGTLERWNVGTHSSYKERTFLVVVCSCSYTQWTQDRIFQRCPGNVMTCPAAVDSIEEQIKIKIKHVVCMVSACYLSYLSSIQSSGSISAQPLTSHALIIH